MLSGDPGDPRVAGRGANPANPGNPAIRGNAAAGNAIVISNASRRFGSVVALDDLSLSVPFGTTLGVIGPSGAGKTTTIRMLTGGLAPTHGEVHVLGENPRHFRRQTRERIGYMPQLFVLYPDLTAKEN